MTECTKTNTLWYCCIKWNAKNYVPRTESKSQSVPTAHVPTYTFGFTALWDYFMYLAGGQTRVAEVPDQSQTISWFASSVTAVRSNDYGSAFSTT